MEKGCMRKEKKKRVDESMRHLRRKENGEEKRKRLSG